MKYNLENRQGNGLMKTYIPEEMKQAKMIQPIVVSHIFADKNNRKSSKNPYSYETLRRRNTVFFLADVNT